MKKEEINPAFDINVYNLKPVILKLKIKINVGKLKIC